MASFLDTFSSAFTGQAGEAAADRARATLLAIYGSLVQSTRDRTQVADDWTREAYGTARPIFLDGANAARRDLQGGYATGLGELGQNFTDPLREGQARSDWSTYLMEAASGMHGPAGNAAARQAFQTGPGYQFALEQGLDAVARQANAAGMGASGNAMREAQVFGQGLANQEYQRFLGNLQEADRYNLDTERLYAPISARGVDLQADLGRQLGNLDLTTGQWYSGSYLDEAARRQANQLSQMGLEVNLGGIFGPNLAQTDIAAGQAIQQAGANSVNLIDSALGALGNITFRPGR